MASRGTAVGQGYQPNSTEVTQWMAFAQLAGSIAMEKSRAWSQLKTHAERARTLRVFGPNGRGNVCIRLIEVSCEAHAATDPAQYRDELGRLADAVLKRCVAWGVVRAGEVARGF